MGLCKSVLVVEDNEDTRELIVRTLEHYGFIVESAGNGAEALKMLTNRVEPTLILLDMMMPVTDGWKFLKDKRRGHHRVVTITAVNSDTLDEMGVGESIDGSIHKPLYAGELISVVRQFCAPILGQSLHA